MRRPRLTCNTTAAFVAFAIVGPIVWMLMEREPPFTRTSGEIIPQQVSPGDIVRVKWNFTVKKNCPPSQPRNVTRSIVDAAGKIHQFESDIGRYGTTPNPPTVVENEIHIPVGVEIGPARYRSKACFACNPVHRLWPVCVDRPELHFEVVKR